MRKLPDAIAIIGLIFMVVSIGIFWSQLPALVPTHFGASGSPNSYGSKISIWMLPIVGFLLYCFLTLLSLIPMRFTFSSKAVAEQSGQQLQPVTLEFVGWLKAEAVWTFAWLNWTTLQISLGRSSGLSPAFPVVTLGAVVITIAVFLIRIFKLLRRKTPL
ncbi:MAG: DUF1648 domain-containing protein [Candidatus Korobacteraceae bacterium]|jgi:uncharacterized membrane protein